MKYLKLYENFDDIDNICTKYNIENYTVNQDDTLNVESDVNLFQYELSVIPLMFKRVIGLFNVGDNNLTSLKGCPDEVSGYFTCHGNKLTDLKYCTKFVGSSHFSCAKNKLTTLIGGPLKVNGNYNCAWNNLKDMVGFPQFYIENYNLDVTDNPVNEIIYLVVETKRIKFIKWLNEYDVIRDGNKIVEMRLEEAYYMVTKQELPINKRKFKNYILI